MSLPRINRSDEGTAWVVSASAASSFTTHVPVLHDETACVEIIYAGLDDVDGTVELKAANHAGSLNPCAIDYPVTMTTANSSIMFNIKDMGYSYLYLIYDAGSNTTGTVTADLVRKQKS